MLLAAQSLDMKEGATIVRIETGPLQFGNDWPGVFVRGDEAMTTLSESGVPLSFCQTQTAANTSILSALSDLADTLMSRDSRKRDDASHAASPQAEPAFGGRRMAYRLRENRMMGFGGQIALEFRGR
jgi:hypothetical protein